MTAPIREMLRLYRAVRCVEQQEVAAEIGITASALSRFERNDGRSLDSAGTIKLIAWLFDEENEEPPQGSLDAV